MRRSEPALESLREKLRIRESETESLVELSSVDSPAELRTETFERELQLTTLTMVDEELREVDDALRRLAGGTYGICETCGRPIAEARLQAKPARARLRGGSGPPRAQGPDQPSAVTPNRIWSRSG